MSLIGTIRAAINGTGTWADVESKATSLVETGALDALEALENVGAAFLTKFAPAETQAVATAGASLLTGTNSGAVASTLLSQTETNAENAAEGALSAGNAPSAPTSTTQASS
jgi:hypothetical protein